MRRTEVWRKVLPCRSTERGSGLGVEAGEEEKTGERGGKRREDSEKGEGGG